MGNGKAIVDQLETSSGSVIDLQSTVGIENRTLGVGVSRYAGTAKSELGQYVQNGDTVPAGTTHLAVVIDGKVEDVAMSPITSGTVSLLTETSATIGGTPVTLHVFRNGGYQATNIQLQSITPRLGEQWFNTTDNTIHMGDGVTPGGRSTDEMRLKTEDLINGSFTKSTGVTVETACFSTPGDGGGGKWVSTGVTGQTPSQTPEQLGDTFLNDSDGNQWKLVYSDKLILNQIGMSTASSCGAIVSIGYKKILDSRIFVAPLTIPHHGLTITAKPGVYFTEESINAQKIDGTGWTADFTGVAIEGRMLGKTILDMLGSRFGRTIGLHLIGSNSAKPAIGLQYGRLEKLVSADNLQFINVKTSGHFTFTAVYNLASETEYWEHLEIYNSEDGDDTSGFCHVFDGNNTFGAITDFTAPTMTQYTDMSNVQHTFVNPDWRKFTSSGPAIWMSRARQFNPVNGYLVCNDDHAIIMSCDGDNFRNINFDIHLEKDSCLGLVRFEKDGGTANTEATIAGWRHRDHNMQTSNTAYRIGESMTKVTLEDADIHIEAFNTLPPNGLVVPASKIRIQGDIYTPDSTVYKGFEFYGTIKSRNAAAGAYGRGTYTIIDVANGKQWHKGDHNFLMDKPTSIAAGTLPTQDTMNLKEESVQFPPSGAAPNISSSRYTLAVDDGSNWSGANPTGFKRLVFNDGTGWKLVNVT